MSGKRSPPDVAPIKNGSSDLDADLATHEIVGATMEFVASEIERKLDTSDPEVARATDLIRKLGAASCDATSFDDAEPVADGTA